MVFASGERVVRATNDYGVTLQAPVPVMVIVEPDLADTDILIEQEIQAFAGALHIIVAGYLTEIAAAASILLIEPRGAPGIQCPADAETSGARIEIRKGAVGAVGAVETIISTSMP